MSGLTLNLRVEALIWCRLIPVPYAETTSK